jgi:Ni,Fe-hydrogenase I large subunit
MKMSKQTAVEFLVDKIFNDYEFISLDLFNAIKEAQAMHREEIEEAQSYAISNADMTNNKGYFDCEKYYNETYGGQDEQS